MATTEASVTTTSTATTTNDKKARQQLAKIVDLSIAPPRIRRFYDRGGINLDVETRLNEKKDAITKLKKAGGPALPKAPEHPGKDASDAAKAKYKEDRKTYDSDLKKYNDYTSDRYEQVEKTYAVCKALNKLHEILTKKGDKTENHKRDLADVTALLQDMPAPKGVKETDEAYKARVAKFEKPGYAAMVAGVDLQDGEAVKKKLTALRKAEPELENFFDRDAIAKERIRFNDPAAVALATTMEMALEEMIEFGIKNTRDLHKKIIQPDYCVRPGVEKLNFYSLFNTLRPLCNILDRQTRKREWEEAYSKAKREAFQAARSKAKKNKKKYERPDFKYPTFPESEVEGGFATSETHKDDKGVERPQYYWYGIDVDWPDTPNVNEETAGFNHYIGQVCKKVMDHHVEIGDSEAQEIRFSNHLRKFLSDIIIAFISRISPIIRIIIKSRDVKTIDHEVIKTALNLLLVSGYQNPTGIVELKEEHRNLFERIDEKVALCQKHQTGAVNKAHATDDDDDDEEDTPATTLETGHTEDPVPTSATAEVDDEDDDEEDDDLTETKAPVAKTAPKAPVAKATPKVSAPTAKAAPKTAAPKTAAPKAPVAKAAPKADARSQVHNA